MLPFLFITTLVVATNPSDAPADTPPPTQTAPPSEQAGPSILVHVNGMVCSFCVQGLERGMRKLDGVSPVRLSLEDKTIALWIAPKQQLTNAVIEQQIRDSGFDVAKIVRPTDPVELDQNP